MSYEIGTMVFGDWEIVREIGHGAYGHVYEIQKTEFGVTVSSAMKLIQIPTSVYEVNEALNEGMEEESVSEYFRELVDDFVQEIAILSKLSGNPNIVGYQDHCVVEHTDEIGWDILIRMELLETLADYLRREKTLKEDKIIQLGSDVANALMTCEQNGIIHRDVKPDNIFVTISGEFKLGDFGIARVLEKTTGGLSKKGTESYMAPEIYQGKAYGKTVDIYALGLVLYHVANHRRLPFVPLDSKTLKSTDKEQALIKRMQGSPLPVPCDASPELAAVILKACAYETNERWQSAAEMKAALDNLSQGQGENVSYIDQKDEVSRDDDQVEETVGYEEWLEKKTDSLGKENRKNEVKDNKKNDDTDPDNDDKDKKHPNKPTSKPGKKNKGKSLIWVCIVAAAILGVMFYAFMPKTKPVTVIDGSGSGDYKKGVTVNIKAKEKEQYHFASWMVNEGDITLKNASEEETSFVMGKMAVEVAATYEKKTYLVTVENGIIQSGRSDSHFTEGTEVTIQAEEKEGYSFAGWTVNEGDITLKDASKEKTSFVMGKTAVEVAAKYEKKRYLVTVENGTIQSGGSDSYFTEGTEVTIQAKEKDGYDFAGWTVNEGDITLKDASKEKTSFVMGKTAVEVAATYEKKKYMVTVENGIIQSGRSDSYFTEGTEVTIQAEEKEGYDFAGWTVNEGDISLKDASKEKTSFVMGKTAAEVAATYEKKRYQVTVENGTIQSGGSDTYFTEGTKVTIQAEEKEGYSFAGWTVNEGDITLKDASKEKTSFMMGKTAVEVAATYEKYFTEESEATVREEEDDGYIDTGASEHTVSSTQEHVESFEPEAGEQIESSESEALSSEPGSTSIISHGRDLAPFIGEKMDKLISSIGDAGLKAETEDEIKYDINDQVRITGIGNGTITRIYIHGGTDQYCVEPLYLGLAVTEAKQLLQENGYSFVGISSDNEWYVWENEKTKRSVAYKIENDRMTGIYFAMKGYLPIKV